MRCSMPLAEPAMKFTTLVPAYKPKYLVELLTALRHQTVKPARVIFSDDSPNGAFLAALGSDPIRSAISDLNVDVVPGPRSGGYNNFRHLLQLYRRSSPAPTELFHLLLDDDIPYPGFYERHLHAHSSATLQCVVSRRWTATESGQPIRDLPVPPAIAELGQTLVALQARVLFGQTVGQSANWLGEFSNTTFRASMAAELDDPSFGAISFAGLEDLGAFLKASLHGPIGYINQHLGYFRTSADQHSARPMGRPMKLAFLAYIALAIASRDLGMLTAAQCAGVLGKVCPIIQHYYGAQADVADLCAVLPRLAVGAVGAEAEFLARWKDYVGSSASHPAPA